jgi:hypothetical protein
MASLLRSIHAPSAGASSTSEAGELGWKTLSIQAWDSLFPPSQATASNEVSRWRLCTHPIALAPHADWRPWSGQSL